METQVNIIGKSPSFLKRASAFLSGAKVFPFLLLLLSAAAFAQTDYSTLTSGLESEISGAKTIIMGLAAAVLGVAVVFVIYRLVRKMVG